MVIKKVSPEPISEHPLFVKHLNIHFIQTTNTLLTNWKDRALISIRIVIEKDSQFELNLSQLMAPTQELFFRPSAERLCNKLVN